MKHTLSFDDVHQYPGRMAVYPFFDVVKITADALARVLSARGWQTFPEQHLALFKPMSDSDSYLVQACDVISNFTLNLIKKASGRTDDLIIKKAELLTSSGLFGDVETDLANEFEEVNGVTVNKSSTLKHNIEAKPQQP